MIRINNVLIDPEKISHAIQDPTDISKVTVYFDNGEPVVFVGQEAAEIWRLLDDDDWRNDD